MYASNFSFLLEDMFARAVPDKLANYIQISYHTVGNVKAGKSFTLTSTVTKGVWAVVGGGWCWCPIIKILSKLKEKGKRQEKSDNWWESGWHWLGPCQRWANICQWQLLLKLQNYFAFFFNPPWKTGACAAWYLDVCPRDDIGLQSEMFNICWLDICDHLISSLCKLNNTIVCRIVLQKGPSEGS